MENLWQFLEEEKNKAIYEKWKEIEMVKKQHNNMEKEYNEALAILQANYIFNCFLLDLFPRFIKILIENNHNAVATGNSIKGEILLSLKKANEFEAAFYRAANWYACGKCCTDKMIYSFEDNKTILKFKDKLIYSVFKEKLNLFLIKNNIISVNELNGSNLILYLNPIYFNANIVDLIRAYENGVQQIEEEKEALKALMDTWNIREDYAIYLLNITPKYYTSLLKSAKKEMQLIQKKK